MPLVPRRGLGLVLVGWLSLGIWLGWPAWALAMAAIQPPMQPPMQPSMQQPLGPIAQSPIAQAPTAQAPTVQAPVAQAPASQSIEWGDRCVRQLQTGQYEAAVDSCEQALALDLNNPAYRLNHSVALYRNGHYQAALAAANASLALSPQDYRGYYNRGLVQVALHDFPAAIADFDRAVELGSASLPLADIYDDRGLAKLMAAQPAAAIADFDRALALNPEDVRALFNRSCACHQLGQIGEALTALNQVLALEPDHARTYLKRGVLRQALGDQMGGIADLQQAADCAQAQGQPHLHHHILTLLNEWQSAGISVG